jgi:hypothetical protein
MARRAGRKVCMVMLVLRTRAASGYGKLHKKS